MTFVLIALVTLLLGVFLLLCAACAKIENTQREVRDHVSGQHTRCIDRVGAAHDVALLRKLADRWESAEEQWPLRVLANEEYTPGGPSMPTLWLRRQADIIEREIQ